MSSTSATNDASTVVKNFSSLTLLLVAIMFVFSGAAALIYEVVWTRQLITFFGSSLYGVATVLSAFMGGLALGSYVIGKRADKYKYPLFMFGIFEIGIALTALIFPYVLRMTQPIIGAVYATGGEGTFYLYSIVRFIIVFALLMVPTTLMGATLPVLSKGVTMRMDQVGKRIGGLYALNTAGAVLGVFIAGFVLLEHLGVFYTTLVAVSADFTIGVVCVVMGRKYFIVADAETQEVADEKLPSTGESYSPKVIRFVMASYAISGFVALAYQVCWTRSLIFSFDLLKATTYSFSGMLVVFLMGLALGGALMQGLVDKQKNLLRLYALLQTGIGIGGGLSFFMMVNDWPALQEMELDGTLIYWNAVGNVMYRTALAIALPTFLMGMAFPVVSKIVVSSMRNLSFDIARVYALNTVGAIFGSFAAGFILIPFLGITGTLAILIFINMVVAAVLFGINPLMMAKERFVYTGAAILVAILIPARLLTTSATFHRLQNNENLIHYEEGALATVTVIENNSLDRMIYVDGVGVAGTDKIMLTDQKSLAHVPMMLLGAQATNVLSVGFGSGGASFSYTLYEDLENIHTIEIAPEVLRAAPTLTASNHGIIYPEHQVDLAVAQNLPTMPGSQIPTSKYTNVPVPGFRTFDPRFKVLVDDARSYLRFSDVKYDVIATDCTDLRYKSNANLYDLEYFTLCREAITDRGLVVVWMPLGGLSEKAFRSALRTFQEVFPEMSTWYFTNQPTHYCLLIGGRGPVRIDYDAVRKAVTLPRVSEDLEEIGLADPDKLISSFVNDERTLVEHLEGFPLNTEDHPIIEFESPRFGYDQRPLYINQKALYDIQVPASNLLVNTPKEGDYADRIWTLQKANAIVFEGHHLYRSFDFLEACKKYEEALALAPWDESIRRLLNFEEMMQHFQTAAADPQLRYRLNTFWSGHSLAIVYRHQGRYSDAVTVAEEAISILPIVEGDSEEAKGYREAGIALYSQLILAYAQAGKERGARRYLDDIQRFHPDADRVAELKSEVDRYLASTSENP